MGFCTSTWIGYLDEALMMGGGTYRIEPGEYVSAAINIYLVRILQGPCTCT